MKQHNINKSEYVVPPEKREKKFAAIKFYDSAQNNYKKKGLCFE